MSSRVTPFVFGFFFISFSFLCEKRKLFACRSLPFVMLAPIVPNFTQFVRDLAKRMTPIHVVEQPIARIAAGAVTRFGALAHTLVIVSFMSGSHFAKYSRLGI